MELINNYEELKEKISRGICLIYVHTASCGICRADQPRVEELASQLQFPAFAIDPETLPVVRGQWSLFTAPVVLLFMDGKEMHRQARILDFKELEYRMQQLQSAFSGNE